MAVMSLAMAAEPPSSMGQLEAQLLAGEFGPALAMANATNDHALRDQMLDRIAAAQLQAGETMASLSTAVGIRQDLLRNLALGRTAPRAGNAPGGQGGASQADFDSLIDLITSTIAPTSWDEVGGPGSIQPFPTGVYVDPQGVLHRVTVDEQGDRLGRLRARAAQSAGTRPSSARAWSGLRKVSLPRLERQVQLKLAAGLPLDEEMQVLAGLNKIEYVFLFPESGDIVLAGPAGNWQPDLEGRIVSADTGRPLVRLDDLVVILRNAASSSDMKFGCAIVPRQQGLADAQSYIKETSKKPLKPGQKDKWLEGIRSRLGLQDVEIDGIEPDTRVAQVLVEADYRMKLVGIDLEDGLLEVPSYLDLVQAEGKTPAAMDVLRWWFTMNYEAVASNPERNVFQIRGPSVQVLSENELLTARGERIHTGQSKSHNEEFARNFTGHFSRLAAKYPIYAELANVFDLALVAALLDAQHLPELVDWHMACIMDPAQYDVPLSPAPRTVDSVANVRVIGKTQILGAVSGGVRVEPGRYVRPDAIQTDAEGALASKREQSAPGELPSDAWWWD
jgi:hypothetical protein